MPPVLDLKLRVRLEPGRILAFYAPGEALALFVRPSGMFPTSVVHSIERGGVRATVGPSDEENVHRVKFYGSRGALLFDERIWIYLR